MDLTGLVLIYLTHISHLLSIDKSINYGVMVNATEILENGVFSSSAFDELFPNDSSKAYIYFVT